MRAFWGLLIILIGVWILGNNFSWWSTVNLDYVAHFWPLLLIVFGIALLVRKLKFGWLIVLLAFIASVGTVVAFIKNEKLANSINLNQTTASNLTDFSEDMPQGVTKGEVTIQSGATKIKMGSTNDKLIDGKLDSTFFEPVLSVNSRGNTALVNLSMDTNTQWNNFSKGKNDLTVNLTNRIPLDISLDSGASDMDIDLSKLTVSNLTIKAGASSVKLNVGENIIDNAQITMKLGASNLDLTLPNNVGVRATVKSGLSSRDFTGFKSLGGGDYESDNYSTADKKIKLSIDAGVSSINIKR